MQHAVSLTQAALAGAYLLLGEIHDNAHGHRLRLGWIERVLEAGARPAFVFEQFHLEEQAAIDRASAEARARAVPDAKRWLEAVQPASRWPWPHYEPLIALALRHELPIVAGNLSRAALRSMMPAEGTDGLAHLARWYGAALPPSIDERVLDGQTQAVYEGHCKLIDRAQARRLAILQMARDATMARALSSAGRPAVLIAGSGHTRRDLGVARWLPERARCLAVGVIEVDPPPADPTLGPAYDLVERIPAVERADPCAALRR
ncbi:MAG: ChaN family lipoprotein [Casimicrobiaceae bacterium]|nr:ChaN family lipoprotein [Casimicrobiaceae bacterium]